METGELSAVIEINNEKYCNWWSYSPLIVKTFDSGMEAIDYCTKLNRNYSDREYSFIAIHGISDEDEWLWVVN